MTVRQCGNAQFVTFSCYHHRHLLDHVRGQLVGYFKTIDRKDPFWQPRYYPFNLYSEKKAVEKLDYMHLNPVRAGLVEKAVDWAWSSARCFDGGKLVGVPLEWIFF